MFACGTALYGWRCRRSSCCRRQPPHKPRSSRTSSATCAIPIRRSASAPCGCCATRLRRGDRADGAARQRSDRRDSARSDRLQCAFFLIEPVPAKSVALVVEVRTDGLAAAAFDAGPLAVWPKSAPRELVDALLTAVDDDHKKVRLEAIYTLGVVAGASGAPLPEPAARGSSRRSITTTPRSARLPPASSAG